MPRPRVPLTRATLLDTQRSLQIARQGHDLLDRKREILLSELSAVTPLAESTRDDLLHAFAEAYQRLAAARMAMGSDRVRWAALAARSQPEFRITERSVVGAVVPVIRCQPLDERPTYSLAGTTVELDEAARAFAELVDAVCAAAQSETTVVRLADEVRGTQRRVNALSNVVIPMQESIIKMVREALEDSERETFFRAKMLRKKTAGNRQRAAGNGEWAAGSEQVGDGGDE